MSTRCTLRAELSCIAAALRTRRSSCVREYSRRSCRAARPAKRSPHALHPPCDGVLYPVGRERQVLPPWSALALGGAGHGPRQG